MSILEARRNQAIESIMNDFDYERVHHYMVDANWKWSVSTNVSEVPSIEAIKASARSLLHDVLFTEAVSASSGGLHAERDTHDDMPLVTLSFVIETASDYLPCADGK